MRPGFVGWLAAIFLSGGLAPASAEIWEQPSGKFVKLAPCQLIESFANDGDSFMVRSGKNSFLFRLYAVDTAETRMSYPDRIDAQAAHFGITPEQTIQAGQMAEKLTHRLLARPFTVQTCWQDAKGNSRIPRYYAVITLSDGKDLAEELVSAGLARVYGFNPTTPGFSLPKLQGLERLAKSRKSGAYGFAKNASATARAGATPLPSLAGGKVNLNTATAAELEALPGIGPKYAQEIIAGRPFQKIEDLTRIRGVGPKTLAKLAPLLTVGAK